jgi:hypothetical protein
LYGYEIELWIILRDYFRFRIFGNMVLQRISGPKGEELKEAR